MFVMSTNTPPGQTTELLLTTGTEGHSHVFWLLVSSGDGLMCGADTGLM